MKTLYRRAAALAAVAAALLICAGAAFAGTVKIGLMAPITGAFASEGQDMQKIVELMVEEMNKAGGINGNTIELVVEDDGSTPRSAATAASRLVAKGVPVVIGTYGSAVTEASQDIYNEAGIVQVATGSTSIRLTTKGLKRFFRTCPRDDEQGRVAGEAVTRGDADQRNEAAQAREQVEGAAVESGHMGPVDVAGATAAAFGEEHDG